VDVDGHQSLSDKKGVDVICSETDKVRVFPNPVTDQLNVRIESEESDEFTVNVRDVAGRIVLQSSAEVNATVKVVTLSMSSLANGTYSVEVIGMYQKRTFKVLLSK
nr:T9SS type A sorting domain-containing protein [Chitinophagaceae bacterium]